MFARMHRLVIDELTSIQWIPDHPRLGLGAISVGSPDLMIDRFSLADSQKP